LYIYVSLFVFFLIMSTIIPLTGDDWTWKSYLGMERLKSFFENYNGRYISNILEIIIVRCTLVRILDMVICSYLFIIIIFKNILEIIFVRFTLVRILGMAICSSLFIIFMYKISTNKKNPLFIFYILFLVLLMPLSVFSQTLGWTAGYVNYVFSVTILLYFISLYKQKKYIKINYL